MDQPGGGRAHRGARLRVFGGDGALDGWLSPRAQAAIERGPRGPADGRPPAGGAVIHLPMDGPVAALHLALAELAERHGSAAGVAAIVPEPPDGGPPDPAHLGAIARAGLRPGVDLDRCRWTTEGGLWVTSEGRVVLVEVDWSSSQGVRSLAGLLATLLRLPPGSPVTGWLERHGQQAVPSLPSAWATPLEAAYLEAAAAAVAATDEVTVR